MDVFLDKSPVNGFQSTRGFIVILKCLKTHQTRFMSSTYILSHEINNQ